jgi:hypothetical protein
MLTHRGGHGIISLGDAVYVIAGYDGHDIQNCELYREKEGWAELPDIPEPLTKIGVAEQKQVLSFLGGLRTQSTPSMCVRWSGGV